MKTKLEEIAPRLGKAHFERWLEVENLKTAVKNMMGKREKLELELIRAEEEVAVAQRRHSERVVEDRQMRCANLRIDISQLDHDITWLQSRMG